MRTTLDLDDHLLRTLKQLQAKEGKSLDRLVSDLLTRALAEDATCAAVSPPSWIARPMRARVDLSDKDALHRSLMAEEPVVPVTDALLERMVQAIVDAVDPEQIILFGSRGRGEERENSDVDLIVVEAEPFGPERSRHRELVRLYHAVAGFRVPADLLVFSHDDVDYWRDSLNHVLARALREGKVLYERR